MRLALLTYPVTLSSVYSAFARTTSNDAAHTFSSRAPAGSKSVIVQMFEWTWDSVASECTNFVGPAGYGYVQVSPPMEHIQGSQWWTDYQPVSYILTSKRGNRSQFQNMVATCHAAGVKVIADTIFNHMAGIDSGTGVAGSTFTHYNYPGIYETQDFHHCGLTPGDEIVDYTSRAQVQTCQLDNLADLGTDTDYVQGILARYANDLISLGVDGLRLDSAKRRVVSRPFLTGLIKFMLLDIAASDIANILSRLSTKPYITQEVIWGAGEAVQPSEYIGNGDVQEFRYSSALMGAFLGGGISSLQTLEGRGWIAGDQANVFVADHDTERELGPALPRAEAEGGSVSIGSAAMTNWVSPQSQQIAFGRGSFGFVAINNADSPWTATFSTSLPDGSYCDVISGTSSLGLCTGIGLTVSGGSFTATVAARSAIAIHTGAMGSGGSSPGTGTVSVTFAETATTVYGEVC
ncbi:hypothetical protein H0H81_006370 [Sphagnurus paluster]|uniref:Alpha-amylase n=1 Tax=Sphagnurus paluster TaxID=117069 RepID=A0A9P7GS99_9AGAR|nr:hypothetical protein H0H81_006370 [Sphagnurus paluster]